MLECLSVLTIPSGLKTVESAVSVCTSTALLHFKISCLWPAFQAAALQFLSKQQSLNRQESPKTQFHFRPYEPDINAAISTIVEQ
ncbi:hypothetical protein V6N13_010555 [Hibiscus sabdariffa]